MNQESRVEVVDGNGWRKEFPLRIGIMHIGSDVRNDIVLEPWRGTGVAPRHLQLIAVPGAEGRYRAVNLGDADIELGERGGAVISPRCMYEIGDGENLKLGTFTLVFRFGGAGLETGALPAAHAVARTRAEPRAAISGEDQVSEVLGLGLSLPSSVVEPDRPLEGIVTVCNKGNQPGVQFKLEVEGLEPDCYEIGPGPILFPHVEKGVFLRIDHPRGPKPPAGRHLFRIQATAPEAYPGESAIISQEIEFRPYYEHVLRLMAVE